MSTRSSRKLHPVQDPTPVLSSVEALILAQAVWEHGANAWPAVAKVLSKHPLISRPKSFSTGPTCLNMYNHLMKEAGLEYNEANYPPRAAANLKLAEKHYNIRLVELRGLILAEEVKFKTVLSEIDEIRSGRWDDEIKAKVTSTPIPSVESKAGVTAPLSEALPDEAYEGSDLSGVTDTPASPSQGNRDVILIREPTPPDEEETLDVEGGIVEPLSSLPIKEFSPAQTVDMPVVLPHIATEVPSPGAEDHVVPLVNAVPSEVPASPSSISEAPVKSPVIIHDVTSPSPTAERERDEVCENLSGEVHQHMEQKFANESIQQEQVTEKEEEGGEEGVEEGEGEGGEEEEEEEEEQRDAKEEEEEGEEHGYEDMHTGESDRAPSPVTDVSESTQSLRIDMYQDTALDTASGGSEEQAPATSAVPELETEPEEVNEDETMSSGEEPLQVIRRSTRRRRSSASSVQPLQTRGRKNRRHKPVSAEAADTPPLTLDVEPERTPGTDKEVAMDSPRDEDQDLSPAASEVAFTRRRDGKRKASFAEGIGSPRERKKARDDSEPAEEDEPGPSFSISRGRRRTDRTEEQKRFQNVITMLHSQISQHRNGNIFHNPIKPSEAPDYHDIVKRPIDLKTIKMKVKDGAIASSLEFQRDTYLMFANAMIYNRPGSDVYTMAEDMMLESEGHILAFRQTEGFVRGAHRI